MQLHKLCMGCMSDKGNNTICPICGWNEELVSENPVHLRAETLLSDKYIVGKVLGNGGFGITYLGWDKVLSRKVAIKEYLPQQFSTRYAGEKNVTIFTNDNELQYNKGLEKFLEEAQILAKFGEHQNIVSVYDFFRLNKTAYIVMNYVDGITLKEYLTAMGEKIPYTKALAIIAPVMNALDSVHKVNILHRDISPGNIYMCKNGQIKLIDFGASRQVAGDIKSLSVILKPGFAPEEQYRSRGIQGPWTDVYAVAATFYRMLAGGAPQEALERLSEDTIDWESKCWQNVPGYAITCLKVALSVRSKDRYQSIKDFSNELFKDENLYRIIQNSSEELGSEVDKIAKEISRNKQINYVETKVLSPLNNDTTPADKIALLPIADSSTNANIIDDRATHIDESDVKPDAKHTVKFCARCGEKLYEGKKYCSKCGTKVGSKIKKPANDMKTRLHSSIHEDSSVNSDSTVVKKSSDDSSSIVDKKNSDNSDSKVVKKSSDNSDSTVIKKSNDNSDSTIVKKSSDNSDSKVVNKSSDNNDPTICKDNNVYTDSIMYKVISNTTDPTIYKESSVNADLTTNKKSGENEDLGKDKESNESTAIPKVQVKKIMIRNNKYVIFTVLCILIVVGTISIKSLISRATASQLKAVNNSNKKVDSVKVSPKKVIQTVSKDESLNIASKIVGVLPKGYHLDYDHIQKIVNKEYHMIHFYEIVVDNQQTGDSHSATCEWYYIDISDGNIYRMDTSTNSLIVVNEKWSGQLQAQQIVYSKYTNNKYGFSIDYPSDLLTKATPVNNDGNIFSSKDGSVNLTVSGTNNVSNKNVKSLYNEAIKEHSNASYKTQQGNWFVVSWTDGDKIGYEMSIVGSGSINTYIAIFPPSQKKYFNLVLTHLNSSFKNPGVGISH